MCVVAEDSGSAGSLSGWAASSAGSELLRSTCESAPAACNIQITCPETGAPPRTVSLPAGVKLSPVTTGVRQPTIPEQPTPDGDQSERQARAETQQEQEQETRQETQQETQQETRQETQQEQRGAEWAGAVSLMEPLSALPEPLLRRLVESLQRMPEARQMQLVAALTGRRSVAVRRAAGLKNTHSLEKIWIIQALILHSD